MVDFRGTSPEEQQLVETRLRLIEPFFRTRFGVLGRMIEESGGPFICGNHLTIADLALYALSRQILEGMPMWKNNGLPPSMFWLDPGPVVNEETPFYVYEERTPGVKPSAAFRGILFMGDEVWGRLNPGPHKGKPKVSPFKAALDKLPKQDPKQALATPKDRHEPERAQKSERTGRRRRRGGGGPRAAEEPAELGQNA